MSFWATAMVAANSAVSAPTTAMTVGAHDEATPQHRADPDHQEHAGGDHRGRVDQGRHRRRAGHRVGEPQVQRQLGALAARPDEQHHGDAGGRALGQPAGLGGVVDAQVVQRPQRRERQEHGDHEAPVTDAVGDERLLAGGGRALTGVPEGDQEVRAGADALPAEERDEQVRAEDQHQHAEAEQAEVQEELGELRVPVHVPDRVQEDQRADAGDEQAHRHAQRVDEERHVDVQRADRDPGEQLHHVGAVLAVLRQQVEEHADADEERQRRSSSWPGSRTSARRACGRRRG